MDEENIEKNEPANDQSDVRIDNEPDKKLDVSKIKDNIKKNPWMISTIVLGIIALILLVMVFRGGITGGVIGVSGEVISPEDAGAKLVEFANAQGAEAELVEVNDIGIFYEVIVSMRGQDLPLYVTKDGMSFTQSLIPLDIEAAQATANQTQQAQEPADVVKSDKPVVELFVMTHCPYGTQAEKGIIPVFELLGDKIDSTIRFVHYFMHEPEETETPIQVCIREEQGDKYLPYLKCFLEDGDSDRCLTETGIDTVSLDNCKEAKAEEYYGVDSTASEGYGVRGSPSLVINGGQTSSARSPAVYLETICNAFNEAPEECDEELSSATPKSMWGWEESGTDTQAQC